MEYSFTRNIFLKLLILFTGVAMLSSCKKEEIDIPIVTFLYPNDNSNYMVGDTVELSVQIKSISNIKSVQFNLVNSDLIPIADNYNYPVGSSNSIKINYAFKLDDYYMESGDYQLLCKVINEKETKHKYQKISISQISKKLEDVAVISKNSNKINVRSLGVNLTLNTLKYQLKGDYSSSVYIPYYHRFAISGYVEGDMVCWDYFTNDTLQKIKYTANPPFPFFSTLANINNYLLIGYYQGFVELYNYAAYHKYTIPLETNYYPTQVFDLNNHFMIEEKQINGSKKLISVNLDITGAQYASFMLAGKLIGAFPFDGHDDMIFYNDNNKGKIAKYVYNDNANNFPVNYNSSAFISVAQIDAKNYLLSTADALLWYQYQSSSITTLVNNVALENLCYDNISGRLYATEGQNIVVYSIPGGTLLNTINIGEEILNLHLIYNK